MGGKNAKNKPKIIPLPQANAITYMDVDKGRQWVQATKPYVPTNYNTNQTQATQAANDKKRKAADQAERDEAAVKNLLKTWDLPRILQPKFSASDMRRTMAQAKMLLASFRRFESLRSNPISPDDSRSVWQFLNTRRELNTGKMCYFMHQAGFDLDSDGDSIMKAGDVSCGCYDKSKGKIPECYLLVLFYFISASKVENGLYNFDQKGYGDKKEKLG